MLSFVINLTFGTFSRLKFGRMVTMPSLILLVEDDQSIQNFVKTILSEQGHTVRTTQKGIEALSMINDISPDLVLLDLQLPDMQGESVCKEAKKLHPTLPIVMLTAKSSLSQKIDGLNSGADDYITKPFAAEELLARVNARLRTSQNIEPIITVADLELDTQKVEVRRAGKAIPLTPQEYRLLEYFMQNPGIVLTREMILNKIWAYSFDVETRVVDVYVGYLRKKIDTDFEPKLIHSVRGFGYTLKVE